MDSSVREKYSISSWFYLFCFLLFLSLPAYGQEILWSVPGVGARPNLSLIGEGERQEAVMVTSPFGTEVKVLKMSDGSLSWSHKLREHVPYSALTLTDGVLVQGHQGTVWAFNNENGEILWQLPAPESLDYPMAPPRFRDGAVFTISRKGVVRRLARTGQVTASARKDVQGGRRAAETVPFRSNQKELSYLDQSGRFSTFEPANLSLVSSEQFSFEPPGDVLAGAYLEGGETLWMVSLPGELRAVLPRFHEQSWVRSLGSSEELWDRESELLAVPSPMTQENTTDILLVTRRQAVVYEGSQGSVLTRFTLPSEAVSPPAYERDLRTRWILCREHLVALSPELKWTTFPLPLVDTPFIAEVTENLAIIGSLEGRVYLVRLSSP